MHLPSHHAATIRQRKPHATKPLQSVPRNVKRLATKQTARRIVTRQNARRLATKLTARRLVTRQNARRIATRLTARRLATRQTARRLATRQNAKRIATRLKAKMHVRRHVKKLVRKLVTRSKSPHTNIKIKCHHNSVVTLSFLTDYKSIAYKQTLLSASID